MSRLQGPVVQPRDIVTWDDLDRLVAGMSYFAVRRKIHLIAEGIETSAELQTLRSLGIHFGQGFLLGRPQDGRGPDPWSTRVEFGELQDIQ